MTIWKGFEVEGSRLKGNGPGKRGRAKQRRLTTESAKYAETGLFWGSVYSVVNNPVPSPKSKAGGGTEGDIRQCGRYHKALSVTPGDPRYIGSDRLITGYTQVLTGNFFAGLITGGRRRLGRAFSPWRFHWGRNPGRCPGLTLGRAFGPPGQARSSPVKVSQGESR